MNNSDSANLKVIDHPVVLQEYLEQVPEQELISITAPLRSQRDVFIGMYTHMYKYVIIHVHEMFAENVFRLLYEPQSHRVVFHGIKTIWEDLKISEPCIRADKIICTKLLAYLLHPEWEEHEYFLTSLAERLLGFRYPYAPKDVYGAYYPQIFYKILPYDAYFTHALAQELIRYMDDELWWLYRHVELPLAVILNQMTLSEGLGVDRWACLAELEKTQQEKRELERQMFPDGKTMPLYTDKDAYRYLMFRIPIKSRYARDRGQVSGFMLDELACDHEEAGWVSRWRELSAAIGFFYAALNQENEGRIRSTWKQTIAKTGRIVARDYAVQNVKRECREFLVPDPGHVIIKADYSQSQLRILAHLSEDKELMKAYLEKRDLHLDTGLRHSSEEENSRVGELEIRKKVRSLGKDINFAICFGTTPKGLAGTINRKRKTQDGRVDVATASLYIKEWNTRFPKVKPFFIQRWKEILVEDDSIRVERSPLGRKRDFTGDNPAIRRQHRAQVLQAFEADMLKLAMVRIHGLFKRHHMKARLVMTIHDSLWIHAPIDEEELIEELVRKEMTRAIALRVPLRVDIETEGFETPSSATMTRIFSQESFK